HLVEIAAILVSGGGKLTAVGLTQVDAFDDDVLQLPFTGLVAAHAVLHYVGLVGGAVNVLHHRNRAAGGVIAFARRQGFDFFAVELQQALGIGLYQPLLEGAAEALDALAKGGLFGIGGERVIALDTGIGAHDAARESVDIDALLRDRRHPPVETVGLAFVITLAFIDGGQYALGGLLDQLVGVVRFRICEHSRRGAAEQQRQETTL